MSLSNKLEKYQDCLAMFDAALRADWGIVLTCNSESEATFLRLRLHKARRLTQSYGYDNFDVKVMGNEVIIRRIHLGGQLMLELKRVPIDWDRVFTLASYDPMSLELMAKAKNRTVEEYLALLGAPHTKLTSEPVIEATAKAPKPGARPHETELVKDIDQANKALAEILQSQFKRRF